MSCLIWWRITFLREKHHWAILRQGGGVRACFRIDYEGGKKERTSREREECVVLESVIINSERKRNLLFSMRTRYLLLTSRKNNSRPFASSSSSSSSSSVFYLLEASYTRQVKTNRDSSDRLLSRTYSVNAFWSFLFSTMKYVISRQFSFKNEKFEIVRDSTTVYKVKATPSKDRPGQFK